MGLLSTRKQFQKIYIVLVLITISFTYIVSRSSSQVLISHVTFNNTQSKCDKTILQYADDIAKSYIKSGRHFEECDILNSTDFVIIADHESTQQVIYSVQVNIEPLLNITKADRRGNVTCKLDLIEKVMNVSEKSSLKVLNSQTFEEKLNYTLYVNTHGFYHVSCYTHDRNKSLVVFYDDVISILPRNMSKLLDERKRLLGASMLHQLPHEAELLLGEKDAQRMNVLMMGFDSLSYLQMRRTMPVTFNYLTNVLQHNVMFSSFNVVAENTFPNLLTLLTGIVTESVQSLNLTSEIEKYKRTDGQYFDKYPFIWYQYEKNGYVTAYQEDYPSLSTFNFNRKGFRLKPTAFYARPFWVKKYSIMQNSKNKTKECNHGKFVHKTFFKIIENFLTHMNANEMPPYFSFNFLTQYTHDHFLVPSELDQQLTDMLIRFEKKGYLDNTLAIYFGDHGHRLVPYSYQTETGKFEKYLPFLSVRLPKQLRDTRYGLNLKQNKNRLIGFYDVYQTLRHFSNLNANYTYDNTTTRHLRGISLFEQIPEHRTCADALISDNFCACLKRTSINETQFQAQTKLTFNKVTDFVVGYINNITRNIRDKCVKFRKDQLHLVTSFGTSENNMFQLVIILQPGNAWFEVTIRTKPLLAVLGKVIRLNLYGDQSHCVYDPVLKNYCFCKDKLK